jgi:dienelactone hydrolase
VFRDDAIEAVRFLRSQPEIDPARVGVWGVSEGGMLATQVAARSPYVAFAINSSGFMVPMWEQVLFNIEAQLKADGFPRQDVADAVRFETLAIRVMRSGEGWEEFEAAQGLAKQT